MVIHIIAVGDRMPVWVEAGYQEYAKRVRSGLSLKLIEIVAGRRTKAVDIARVLRDEGTRVLAKIPPGTHIVALERTGRTLNTEQLTEKLRTHMTHGSDLALLVGGPEGLAPECLTRADEHWSLSGFTLAHPVVRVVLAEQLYRAWSVINNLPYHR